MPIVALWSMKAGVGVSTFAAILAASLADDDDDEGVLLVDLSGDLPLVLALAPEPNLGVADWLAASPDDPGDALRRLEVAVVPGLALLPRGVEPALPAARLDGLLALLRDDVRTVVVDCGCLGGSDSGAAEPGPTLAQLVVDEADIGWLVTRLCYLGVRASRTSPVSPSGVVVIAESGRALTVDTVAEALETEVVFRLAWDPVIARLVDAGLLVSRLPRRLRRAVAGSLPDVLV